MIIKCAKCGKVYEYEKHDGICPKCSRYNRNSSSAEEHQEYHNKYDGGYDHSASDGHHSFHERYDETLTSHAAYRETPAEHAGQLDGVQETLREVMGAEHKVNLESKSTGKVKMDKKAKIILGIVFGVFFLNLVIPFLGPILIIAVIAVAVSWAKRKK